MPQPPRYEREKNFTLDLGNKTDHSALNAEFDSAANSINDIRANMAILQADDGNLRPSVVTPDSISPELRVSLVEGVIIDAQDMLNRSQAAAAAAEAAETSAKASSLSAATSAAAAQAVAMAASTDAVPEGESNLYFTYARVRDAVLSGLSTATNAVVQTTDTVLSALGKLQAQVLSLANAITEGLAGKVSNAGDETIAGIKTFSSSPVVPTVASSDNSTKAASTAFVQVNKPGEASTSVAGLMSAADKAKLDGIASGATVGIGVGQTWQVLTGSRSFGTTYYNTTGKPIAVRIKGSSSNSSSAATVTPTIGGVALAAQTMSESNATAFFNVGTLFMIIPTDESYLFTGSNCALISWEEMR